MRGHGRGLDGQTVEAAGTGKAASCGSGGGGGVAYEARGYKQGWADRRAGKTCKPTAQIRAILARILSFAAAPGCEEVIDGKQRQDISICSDCWSSDY